MAVPSTYKWQFLPRFRKSTFGWRGSRSAIERIAEAISEIKRVAGSDPVLGAEGAIKLLERTSPALEHVDSSSGALGSAVNVAIDELVPLIAAAPAEILLRRKWLDRLWRAFCDDQIPYIEQLGDHWGALCAEPQLASEWADRLLAELCSSFAQERSHGSPVLYFNGTSPCFSALFFARRYDEIFDLIDRAPYVWWHYRRWGFRVLVEQGNRAEALRYAEESRGSTRNDDFPISRACEALLLDSGMVEEAYRRYGIVASGWEPTYLGRFRALAKKYPSIEKARLLRDLVASTPGVEGKWFAAAKAAGLYDEAVELANASPCDPKTLGRAARDFREKRPEFAFDIALAALRWFAKGYGYEVIASDIVSAYREGLRAAESIGRVIDFQTRAAALVGDSTAFFRQALARAGVGGHMRQARAKT